MNPKELNEKWEVLTKKLNSRFNDDLDVQAIIFLIGLQELGKGFQKYKKDEKLNIMHVAICTLLEPFGFYEFEGKDKDGWPHWKTLEKLPSLKSGEQLNLMKQAIVDYFEKADF